MLNSFKNYFYILVAIIITTNSYGSELREDHEAFSSSPKFLVHIGFKDGLPKDGIMRSSSYDPCLYFSLNGPFPQTQLMPKLDSCKNAVVIPLTLEILNRCISFHPTEILLLGSLDLINSRATLICSEKEKIPESFSNDKVVKYAGKGIEARNNAIRQFISDEGGYPSLIHLDENDS